MINLILKKKDKSLYSLVDYHILFVYYVIQLYQLLWLINSVSYIMSCKYGRIC